MSDIIKTGVVRIDFVRGKNDVKPPDFGPMEKAREREKSLVEEILAQEEKVKAARDAAAAAAVEASEKVVQAQMQQMQAVGDLAEGLLKMGRAAILAGATGSDSIKQLVESLMAAQVAMDVFKGGQQALKGFVTWIGAARAATLGLAADTAVLTAAAAPYLLILSALAAAYILLAQAEERARQQAEEMRRAFEASAAAASAAQQSATDRERNYQKELRATLGLWDQIDALRAADPEAQLKAIADRNVPNMVSGNTLQADQINNDAMSAAAATASAQIRERAEAEKALADQRVQALDDEAKLIQLKQQELTAAEGILKAEKAKTESFLAQFGALTKGEQERLKRIDKKITAGDQLSRGELETLGKAGGRAAEAAARIYTERARAAGGESLLFGGKDTAAAAGTRVGDLQGELGDLTGGRSSEEALRAITQQSTAIRASFAKFLELNDQLLRKAISQQIALSAMQAKLETAAAYAKNK